MTTLDKTFKAEIDYVMQYGGRCRDCADNYGTCPVTNLPCAPDEARAAIQHILKAVAYGREHGYLDALSSIPEQGVKLIPVDPTEEMIDAACGKWANLYPAFPGEKSSPTAGEVVNTIYHAMLAAAPSHPAAVAVTDEMVNLACKANIHPLSEPSTAERKYMRAALEAALVDRDRVKL